MKKMKKIHFFKFDMYELGPDNKGNSVQKFIDISRKNAYLKEILKDKLNTNRSIKILKERQNPTSDSAIMEIINETADYVFGKLGKEHDINQFQIRKNDTLESRDISKEADELFESFSYFLIDKATFSVSYIKESTAPGINYLATLITNEFMNTAKVRGLIECLVDEEAIKSLSGKNVIGTISYDVTLPPEYTKSLLGLSESEYGLLQNQKGIKVGVTLRAEKRKTSVFSDSKDAESFFTKMLKNKLDVSVKAKDTEDEIMQDFRLVDNPFTKKVNFEYDINSFTNVKSLQTSIENQLWIKMQQNKGEILKYIGFEETSNE
ncbi:hypothetical protein [Carnobacterium divergens]|uniref:hypothetical protein n=1 Tax=Carnobacterium divergens TaxID=2748 RepID=UPI0028902CB3|nr:hypothetical protein [Carnobacterium divergens]MDT2011133.1 hypothetical protein [Carnobacterium divergens]